MNELDFRNAIVDEARRWIGTPYIHQASVCGQGADCLGLIRGIWRNCIGPEPQTMPAYSPDWGEVSDRNTMLDAAVRWFEPIENEQPAEAGDIVLFRWNNSSCIKHVGVITGLHNFIHAYEKAGVVETTLGSQWRKRIAAKFRFPRHLQTGYN